MVSWSDFAAQAPALAESGRSLIYRTSEGEALLATVRDDEPPRIHPIVVAIHEGRLLAFVFRSPKHDALVADGRYALHSHQDPAAPSEFMVRGRARVVDAAEERASAAAAWSFQTGETYTLFEFLIETALLGERRADEWPPRYSRWSAGHQ